MASTVSHLPKLSTKKHDKEPNYRKTPAFPLLIGILASVSGLLVFAIIRAINLGIF
jgi:hypothetical protein